MRKHLKSLFVIAFFTFGISGYSNVARDSLTLYSFGKVHLYVPHRGNLGYLPVTVTESTTEENDTPLVFFISGDGGWYSFEQHLADRMAKAGRTTIGLDAKKYFWNRRTPEETAKDVAKLLYLYFGEFKKDKVILMGYSMGADVLPIIFNALPDDIKQGTKALIVLSPDAKADFEIHVSDMLGWGNGSDTYDVIEALKTASSATKVIVLTGTDEKTPIPSKLANSDIRFVTVSGDHHYNNDTKAIFDTLATTLSAH